MSYREASPRARLIASLTQRVTSGLHLGILSFGDRLPSTRQVAREFSVDPRVALAAYEDLEHRGIVEMRPRSGIYVAAPHERDGAWSATQNAWLVDVLASAITRGIPATQLAERVRGSLETSRLRATVLECNDDQLFSVSDELETDYGLDVTAVDIDSLAAGLPSDTLRADCIITTAPHTEIGTRVATECGVPVLALTMCTDLFSEVRRLLPESPVYFVVTDLRFETKLRRIFGSDNGIENLRIMLAGRDDLTLIPGNAPAYLTRLTRKKLGDFPHLDRIIPEASIFSESSARELLEFVVGANLRAMRTHSSSRQASL